MLDPMRLLDEGDGLEVRVLASAAGDAAPEALRARVLAMGAVGLGAGVAASAGSGMGASAGIGVGKGVTAATAAKWGGLAIVAAVAAAGVVRSGHEHRVERVTPAPVLAPVVEAATVAPRAVTREVPSPSVAPIVTAAPLRPAAPSAPAVDLTKELALLDGARAALHAGDTAGAITALDRHDLDYLHGQLAPDALALRIEAYAVRLDDTKVVELSRVFLARYPDHPEAPHVRAMAARAGGEHNP